MLDIIFLENGFLENRFETLIIFLKKIPNTTSQGLKLSFFFLKIRMHMGEIDYATKRPKLHCFRPKLHTNFIVAARPQIIFLPFLGPARRPL